MNTVACKKFSTLFHLSDVFDFEDAFEVFSSLTDSGFISDGENGLILYHYHMAKEGEEIPYWRIHSVFHNGKQVVVKMERHEKAFYSDAFFTVISEVTLDLLLFWLNPD